ncbi:MAG: ABC transporter permease [FCB group bacterium]|nr:ABC transporter permease [FCB group bacterium]
MARFHLGSKRVTEEQIAKWKRQRGYHLPYFFNNGWSEVGLREAHNKPVSLQLPAQQAGAYQLRIEVPKPDTGTLKIIISTDKSAVLKLPAAIEPGPIEIDLAKTKAYTLPFSLLKERGRHHPLEILIQPSEEAPQSIARLYFKEKISLWEGFSETIFWKKSIQFLFFNFGTSDDGRNIGEEIRRRIIPSLSIAVPSFIIGIFVNITIAMLFAFYRGTYIDFWGVITCVAMMSISGLFYIIGGQWLFGKALRLVPVSGYDTGLFAIKFVLLPIVIGVISGIGSGVRWYRTIFLEEMGKDYVRTARAKGLPESIVLFRHALKNAMIPILTGVVVTIPLLIIGSLLLESFFAIPGLGSFTLEAIQRQDFAIVQAMVFLGSILYIIGLLMTDISYTLVDPRVRLE